MSLNQPPENNTGMTPPESFYSSNLLVKKLRQWCWLTRIFLLVNIAYLGVLLLAQNKSWELPSVALNTLDLMTLLLWAYILMSLRRLLWFRFHITSVGIFFNTLIVASFCVWAVDGLLTLPKEHKALVLAFVFIIQGVAGMLLAKRLIASEMATPRLKRLGLIFLAASACYASLVMAFLGVALSLTAYWHLSCLFDESANERQVTSNESSRE